MTEKAPMSVIRCGRWFLAYLVVAGLLTACGPGSSSAPTISVPEAAEPDLQTGPTPIVLSLAYQDDFMDQASGWDDAFDAHTSKQYGAHRYHITVDAPNLFARGLANRDASDFVLEVTTKEWEGPNNNSYGVIFRYQDKDNFYRFDITGDGFFLLSKFVNGQWLTLVDWTASPAINQGQAENQLRVSSVGPHVAVYANGELLAEVEDSSFRHGDIGFFAGTFDQPGVHVSFDNLKVWTPPSASVALKAKPTPVTVAQVQPTVVISAAVPTEQGAAPTITVTVIITPTLQVTATPALTPASALAPEWLPDYVSAVQPRPREALTLTGKIAYSVFDVNRGTYDTYMVDLETGKPQLLLENASEPALSPSGKYVAYRSWDNDKRGLIRRDLNGIEISRVITYSEAAHPVWSPSEDSFLFHSRQEPDRISRLYRTRGDIAEGLRRDGEAIKGESPIMLDADGLVYKGCLRDNCGLIVSQRDGTAPKMLTNDFTDTAPAASPDGKKIAFMSRRSGNWDIYLVNRDGSGMISLTSDASNEGLPVWSPDARSIAFLSDRNGAWGLWIMNADGSNQYQFMPLNGSPDGKVRAAQAFESTGWTDEQISWSR